MLRLQACDDYVYSLHNNYRLYDEPKVYTGSRTPRKPEAIDIPNAQCKGIYSGFQGDLNPKYTEGFIV